MPTRKYPLPQPGDRFGRLTVIGFLGDEKGSTGRIRHMYVCACDCGRTTTVAIGSLTSGDTMSCGCLGDERRLKGLTTGVQTALKTNRVGYKGVYRTQDGRWRMTFIHGGRRSVSYHPSAKAAARAYDAMAIELRGPDTCLNFPEDYPDHPNRKPARRTGERRDVHAH